VTSNSRTAAVYWPGLTLRSSRFAVAAALPLVFLFHGQAADLSARQTQASTASLLAGYADWIRGARKDVDLTVFDLDAARQELGRLNPASLPVPEGKSTDEVKEFHRRLVTTFALEIAAVGARRHASAAERLIEWGCQYVRSHSPINDFDRAWELAALAALEGSIDSAGLRAHLAHLHGAFAEDPRAQLASGIAEEQFNAPSEALTRSLAAIELARAHQEIVRSAGEDTRAFDRAIGHYRDAEKIPAVQAEAALRIGHVQLMLHHYDAALSSWDEVANAPGDPALIYLARLFRGLAYEGLRRDDDARAAYASAAALSPAAHSVNMRLAVLAMRRGHLQESQQIIDRLIKDDDPRRDPWWSYYAADWRFWYPRIERVREMLK
jgi:tetratricopeptide (TPR) repeat protein